jgi:DNA repair protein RecO (recombination protein O)
MNTHVSPSIIMRIKEFGESDLLVTFFTSDRGKLKGVAKGARRSRRRFVNCLDLFCLTNLEYELKRKGDLHFLHSCKLINGFPGVRNDFSSLSLASYMIELTEILFPLGVVDQNMFTLLQDSFLALDEAKRKDILRIHFEARAMTLGGYRIDLEKCCSCGRVYAGEGRAVFKRSKGGIACLNCGQESKLSPGLGPDTVNGLRVLQSAPWNEVETLPLTDEITHEIKRLFKLHIEYRIGRRLKTAEYLE